MFLTIGSLKGSPGATTIAVGLAAQWPGEPAVLLEADPAGGDLAARFGGSVEPGLTTLAAAGRSGARAVLAEHTQLLPVGVSAVLAPPGDAAAAAVGALAASGRAVLAGHPAVVDLGRVSQGGAGMALAAASDRMLLVIRPTMEEQAQLAARLPWLVHATSGRVSLVLTGGGPYSARQITDAYGLPVAAHLAWHPTTAGILSGRTTSRFWRSLRLARQLAILASELESATGRPLVPYPAGATR
ncbi:hypothetical protein AB0M43_14685 [Longispora sp. NPDC051575]|uniref:hypothetical protein n=1 Tax=Longispora sp. NPDC051575 TaxID=3154943 RepID=UPI00342D2AC8